jgi:hypothetical protein
LSWCAHIPCIIIRLFPSSSSISSTRSFFSLLHLLHSHSPPSPSVYSNLLYPPPSTYCIPPLLRILPSPRTHRPSTIFYTFHPPPSSRLDFFPQPRSTFLKK